MKTLAFLSTIICIAHAADFTQQLWRQEKINYLFRLDSKSKVLISSQCLDENQNIEDSKCEAALALKKKNTLTLPKESLAGGKNPGAVVCKVGLNRTILVLKDSKNNENAFCTFPDGSMIAAIDLQNLIKE